MLHKGQICTAMGTIFFITFFNIEILYGFSLSYLCSLVEGALVNKL
jgi:hypothetical protein